LEHTVEGVFSKEILPGLSASSKTYFALSSQYFDAKNSGEVQLNGDVKAYTSPEVLSGFDLTIQAPAISFTAWIKTSQQFIGGYLIRKRPVASGNSSLLSCWGWYLDAKSGPQLHFGAHDFFADPNSHTSKQAITKLSTGVNFQADRYSLLTIVVNDSHAIFFENIKILEVVDMPRPITDCFNYEEGVLVGDAGMEMGQLRFYPRALSIANIEEICRYGTILADISKGSIPSRITEASLSALQRSLDRSLGEIHSSAEGQQYSIEVGKVAEAALAQPARNYDVPRMPEFGAPRQNLSLPASEFVPESWNATANEHVTKIDTLNRAYHQIFTGPFLLSKSSSGTVERCRKMGPFRLFQEQD
jgi:hypothetical protein